VDPNSMAAHLTRSDNVGF